MSDWEYEDTAPPLDELRIGLDDLPPWPFRSQQEMDEHVQRVKDGTARRKRWINGEADTF